MATFNLFSSGAGLMVQLPATAALMAVVLKNDRDTFGPPLHKAVISSLQLGEDIFAQFRPTLDGRLLVYTMGDQPGQVMVSGWFARGRCPDEAIDRQTVGFDDVVAFYRDSRASVNANPITLVLGGDINPLVIFGFMTGMRISVADPAPGVGGFSFPITYPVAEDRRFL